MAKRERKISSKEIRRQFEEAKLEVSKQLYDELASKFARPKPHKTL